MPSNSADAKRPSSAGYRFPVGARDPSGALRGVAAAAGGGVPGVGARSRRDGLDGDRVKWERVWTESVARERRSVHTWKKKWGFLTNYNEQGELVFPDDPESNPDDLSSAAATAVSVAPLESEPDEAGGHFPYLTTAHRGPGSNVNTAGGRELIRLDFALSPQHHKRRLPSEMVPF
ncbi:ciliary microtubule inner protein 5 [Petromyzon marinus]|uniref:ciliary microtubule inner protein 5 n=1 Tax=Petromyzon marinus TaxID=7757 RepID=UPI003F7001F9